MATDKFHTHPLHTFLQKHECPAGTKANEVAVCGMGSIKGRWVIPDENYPEFLDSLYDYLFKANGRPINLVEQPKVDKPKPILIDLDFKFPSDTGLNHPYKKEHIHNFVKSISDGLKEFFNVDSYETIRFFVSQRPQAYPDMKNKYVKDGLHIQCPDLCLTSDKQKVLRAWLLDKESVQKSFDGIGYINTPEDVYDESMIRKQGWFFYGESKPSIPPYKLEYVFAYNPSAANLDEEDIGQYTQRELMELLSVRYNVLEDESEVLEEKKELYEKYLKAKAPPAAQEQKVNEIAPAPVPKNHSHVQVNVHIPDSFDGDEIELVKLLAIECLSEERADNYKTWMEVGWCLSNIENSDSMFNTWVEFSSKSGKSGGTDWGKYKKEWFKGGFSRNTPGAKLTIKSLHYWAREDSPEKYRKFIEEDHIRYVQYRVDDTHYHIAKLLKKMYKGRFCASVESRRTEWFVYDEKIHSWRHTNQGIELQEKLSTEVADLVISARMRLKKKGFEEHSGRLDSSKMDSGPDEDWFKKWAATNDGERFMALSKVEKSLYKQDFKGGVMRAAVELFYEEDFCNKLNMNPYLMACKNGVLDLRNEVKDASGAIKTKVIFRQGKPEDFISLLAGRNFPDSEPLDYIPYDPEDEKQKELMEFLSKIFPNPELRSYVIRLMASSLEGMNREQCYYTFIGVGGNGKSKLIDLMRYTFGDYCSSLQATALTRKRPDSGAANPDIIAIKNKRFIYLQEPDEREPLNTSRMKQFSGEDVVEARGLFEDQQRFRITGKLFMMCNRFPPIHAMDRGTWRRIRVILFGSKFVDASDPDLKAGKPNVFLRDNGLDAKLREWREAWLSLLVHVYEKEYIVNGMEPVPSCVLEESNKYKESFDQYGKFKAERMIDFRNPRLGLMEYGNEQVTLRDVQMAYNNWCRQNEGTLVGKKLNKQELQARLDEDFGNLDNGVYKRCIVFFDEDGKADFERERRPDEADETEED
jgi:P4 family phage/plasmid primase-like protien